MKKILGNLLEKRRVAIPWYLNGGSDGVIPIANCLEAHAPKGAASLAASYINLNNPGTNDAYPGDAPGWDDINGWKMDGISDYLLTGVFANTGEQRSAIIRFSNRTSTGSLFGSGGAAGGGLFTATAYSGSATTWFHGNLIGGDVALGAITDGTIATTRTTGYYNGTPRKAISGALFSGGSFRMAIGSIYTNNTTRTSPCAVYIQAIAFYDILLSDAKVLGLHTAMMAL